MRNEPPPGVAERLTLLRATFVAETDAEARARLVRQTPRSVESFEVGVARRLHELRALDDLARHLHRRA